MAMQVCEDWMMRMRPLLLSITVTSGAAHEAWYHAQARLIELRSQMRHLVASTQLQQRQEAERRAASAVQPLAGGKKRSKLASVPASSPVVASGAKVRLLLWSSQCSCVC